MLLPPPDARIGERPGRQPLEEAAIHKRTNASLVPQVERFVPAENFRDFLEKLRLDFHCGGELLVARRPQWTVDGSGRSSLHFGRDADGGCQRRGDPDREG
jgi:hypothetical protein